MAETFSDLALNQTDQVSDPLIALAARLAKELADSWGRGQRLSAESMLARHPEVNSRPEAALRVIYEEICQRQEAGETVKTVEVLGKYPQWQAELAVMLDCHRLLDTPRAASGLFPKVGEMLGGFRLVSELGRGALGRVFLATEPALADRPVVLKATPCDNFEHLSLARLQHTYIVPLYAVYDFPERRLRVLCMPFLGGTTLERLLILLRDQPCSRRMGQTLLQALDAVQSCYLWRPAVRELGAFSESLRAQLARESYVEAVCRIGASLADALAFAHERGLVHLDLKPSNILITADAQPMLLDFNLSQEPLPAGAVKLDRFGGTRGYMPPEQQAAFDAVGDGRPLPMAVDGRADIYALALCLYEALGGLEIPNQESGVRNPPSTGTPTSRVPGGCSLTPDSSQRRFPRLNRLNGQVSVGLADVLHKCLSPDPRRRYAKAADLAADLRCHLRHLPLRGVYNRSLAERWTKWRTRRPLALAWTGVVIAVLTAIFALMQVVMQGQARRTAAESALREGRLQRRQQAFRQAILTLTRGEALAEGLAADSDLPREFEAELRLARRAQAAESLRVAADRLRFALDLDLLTPNQLAEMETLCGRIWEQRGPMLAASPGEFPAGFEERLRADLLDVVVIWTELRQRIAAPDDAAATRRGCLRILREARDALGGSVVLARVMHRYAVEAGEPDVEDSAALTRSASTAREYYTLGRFLMQAGLHAEAMLQLEFALQREPEGFWPNFYQGVCAYRLQRYAEAAQAFRVSIALAPEKAPCWFNRGLACAAQGKDYWDRAIGDYDRALRLDPTLTAAALNRGILHYRQKRVPEAIADFELVLQTNPNHPEAKALLERLRRE